ncbi:MAG: hypothetical protein L0332_14035 [Chloroflexi bacterium]|nr:hypothetical protein [Chloroflexota bacterium]MCI0578604.1 hypothetical protein [Chloroflexota bacterium]MCI0647363.1 hypothetical protein [Chloroflexota bacterium]MCI0727823.1 hypothetical protein [Chloroflexota bacterium]
MAKNSTPPREEISELRSRLEWMDEERRKTTRKLAELEQRLATQERETATRGQRIQELEDKLAKATAQLTRLPQVDTQLRQFKDEMVLLLEQYDQRRIQGQDELDKVRRVEHEVQSREIADIRKELPAVPRLQNEMELRQAEEARLANLIGVLQGKLAVLENQADGWGRDVAFLEEAERKNARSLTEIQTSFLESSRRWEPIENRLDITGHGLAKVEADVQELANIAAELRRTIQSWSEQIQVGEYERNQRLEKWKRALEEHQNEMDRFAKEWIKYSDQYKEARMMVQTMADWQKHIEQQQREASEMARVEANRMRALWDNFLLEHEKRWKSYEVDRDQRWATAQRQERQLLEQLRLLEEKTEKLHQDKELLMKMQSAQAEAVKKFPRIWLEEVEKAQAQNPNSRRQPALVPVREE